MPSRSISERSINLTAASLVHLQRQQDKRAEVNPLISVRLILVLSLKRIWVRVVLVLFALRRVIALKRDIFGRADSNQ